MRTNGSYKIVTAPADEPVTLDEAKSLLALYHNDDDALILGMITAARLDFEARTNYLLLSQTWDLYLDGFPPYCGTYEPATTYPALYLNSMIEVERRPVSAVSYVKYYDADNVLQTVSAANYSVDTSSRICRVVPVQNYYWPQAYVRPNAVNVRFVAGHATVLDVPQDIKAWLKNFVLSMYEQRGTYQSKSAIECPAFSRIVQRYMIGAF